MSELRTAAIEAAAKRIFERKMEVVAQHSAMWRNESPSVRESVIANFQKTARAEAEVAVDAVLPLLVAGTASRIADAIEAKVTEKDYEYIQYWCGYDDALADCAAIARRVGETS